MSEIIIRSCTELASVVPPTRYCPSCETELRPYGERAAERGFVRVYYSCPQCGYEQDELVDKRD